MMQQANWMKCDGTMAGVQPMEGSLARVALVAQALTQKKPFGRQCGRNLVGRLSKVEFTRETLQVISGFMTVLLEALAVEP
jgi:hypothetical protein